MCSSVIIISPNIIACSKIISRSSNHNIHSKISSLDIVNKFIVSGNVSKFTISKSDSRVIVSGNIIIGGNIISASHVIKISGNHVFINKMAAP